MMSVVNRTRPKLTDASGSWGCGGFSNMQWFSLKWATKAMSLHITVKEIVPITIAAVERAVGAPGAPVERAVGKNAVRQ